MEEYSSSRALDPATSTVHNREDSHVLQVLGSGSSSPLRFTLEVQTPASPVTPLSHSCFILRNGLNNSFSVLNTTARQGSLKLIGRGFFCELNKVECTDPHDEQAEVM